jgi:hypothetical protein
MSELVRALHGVAETTLEQIAFTPVMPSTTPFDWDAPDLVWAVIPLEVALRGDLVCGLSSATIATLSQDAWGGAEEGPSAAEAFLLEVANVIGGGLLAALDPEVPPALGLPKGGVGPRAPRAGAVRLDLEVEAGRFGIALELDDADPSRNVTDVSRSPTIPGNRFS